MTTRKLIFLVPTAALMLGCTYNDGPNCTTDCGSYGPTENYPKVESSVIDTGATLAEIEPGQGAGAFVEYAGAGSWHVFAACDTELSSYSCGWDIIVSGDAKNHIDDFGSDRMESPDWIDWYDANSVRFVTDTSYDIDGFFVDAQPGGTLRVDVFLDGGPAHRYIYWVGNGGLHQGSPTNPIDLTPTEP